VAAKLGIEQAQGDCKPQDKLAAMQAAQAAGHKVAMVGDGLNDGPVLAGAHVSFAFGKAVPLAQSRADFVVLGDSLELVLQSLLLARRTLSVVRQNLGWAAAYNAISIPLALVGWMPAWLAGLGMALSSCWSSPTQPVLHVRCRCRLQIATRPPPRTLRRGAPSCH
jgi:Cu2+-exporting ATPase